MNALGSTGNSTRSRSSAGVPDRGYRTKQSPPGEDEENRRARPSPPLFLLYSKAAQHAAYVCCMVLCLAKPTRCLRVAKLQRKRGHPPDVKHVRLTALSHILQTTVDLFRYFYRLGCSPLLSLPGKPLQHSSDVGFPIFFPENPNCR